MRLKHFSTLLLKILLIAAATSEAQTKPINDIICSGQTSLFIDGKAERPNAASSKNLTLEDGVLIISGGQWRFNVPRHLKSLSLHDQCQLRTKHWNGKIKNLIHNSSSDAILDGFFNIEKILKTDSGRLMIYWFDHTQNLTLDIASGKTYLAGQVKNFITATSGQSNLNAQHLIARRILITSKDQSSAFIHPLHSLTAFASGQSHIGYARPVLFKNLASTDQSSIIMEPFRPNN